MIDPAQVFSICNMLVLPGWLLLAIVPFWRYSAQFVASVLIPGILGVVYLYLAATTLPWAEGGFGSLADVKLLLASERMLLAGWIHYLAFDLFIGAWEVRDARRLRVPHLLVVPCLVLTFMLGPVGLLAYLVLRGAWRGVWTIDDRAVEVEITPAA